MSSTNRVRKCRKRKQFLQYMDNEVQRKCRKVHGQQVFTIESDEFDCASTDTSCSDLEKEAFDYSLSSKAKSVTDFQYVSSCNDNTECNDSDESEREEVLYHNYSYSEDSAGSDFDVSDSTDSESTIKLAVVEPLQPLEPLETANANKPVEIS